MPEPILDLEAGKYVCPKCDENTLWESFDAVGWRSIEVNVDRQGDPQVDAASIERYTYGTEWEVGDAVHPDGRGGCSECGWEGQIPGDLKLDAPPRLGWDSKPLYHPIPGQLELTVHA